MLKLRENTENKVTTNLVKSDSKILKPLVVDTLSLNHIKDRMSRSNCVKEILA